MNFNFGNFRALYHGVVTTFRILVWTIFILWIKNSFNYFEEHNFISLFYDINKIEHNLPGAWEIFKTWLIMTGWIMLKIIVLQIVISAIKLFPVPSKWIYKWYKNNEITPIFGRLITNHLRTNTMFSFFDFIQTYKHSKKEFNYLIKHNKNPQLDEIFKKYDLYYTKDLNLNSEQKNN